MLQSGSATGTISLCQLNRFKLIDNRMLNNLSIKINLFQFATAADFNFQFYSDIDFFSITID